MIAGLDGGIASTVAMLGDVEIPGDVPPAIGQRLGAAIAAVRGELPAGLLDDSIATLRQAATAVTDPERRRAVAAAAAALD
jgi:protein involved in polysaccharide export with SLBB domain